MQRDLAHLSRLKAEGVWWHAPFRRVSQQQHFCPMCFLRRANMFGVARGSRSARVERGGFVLHLHFAWLQFSIGGSCFGSVSSCQLPGGVFSMG